MERTSIRVEPEVATKVRAIRAQLGADGKTLPTMSDTVAALADHWQATHPSARPR